MFAALLTKTKIYEHFFLTQIFEDSDVFFILLPFVENMFCYIWDNLLPLLLSVAHILGTRIFTFMPMIKLDSDIQTYKTVRNYSSHGVPYKRQVSLLEDEEIRRSPISSNGTLMLAVTEKMKFMLMPLSERVLSE